MPAHSTTMSQPSKGDNQNLGELLEQLKQHGLTVTPIQKPQSDKTLSIHDLVPDVRPFSGVYEKNGITIDEWRIRMRMRLMQISLIEGPEVSEEFKANYILSMLSGQAFRWIKGKFIHNHHGGNPCAGYNDAQAVLETICDMIRYKIEGSMSGQVEIY